MCGCTSNFVNPQGNIPADFHNAKIGLYGQPFQQIIRLNNGTGNNNGSGGNMSNLTNTEIEQKCWESSNDPDEILACIEREKKLRNQGFWQQGLNWLGSLFGGGDTPPYQGPNNNTPPTPPSDTKGTSPWVYVAVIGGIAAVGAIAYYAIKKDKK